MAGKFCFGAVIKWDGFVFDDGDASNKLLVILGAKSNQSIIAVLTTSKPRNRPKLPGCRSDYKDGAFYFLPGGMKDCFHEDTWVEIYRPKEIDPAEYKRLEAANQVHVVFNLMAQAAAGIRNCLKLVQDASPHHISLLE